MANIVASSGKKISTDTVIDYINYMSESWLLLPIENIVGKITDKATKKKYYFIDNGILNLFLFDSPTSLLENLVAIVLNKRYPNQVYYYQTEVEVDFYIMDLSTAIQVSYAIDNNVETWKRETSALVTMAQHIPVSRHIIITRNEENIIEISGIKIEVIPIWKWLLTEY